MPIISEQLPVWLKDAVTAAFRDNSRIAGLSEEDRELAARAYEQVAEGMLGTEADLARIYNLERARFLRGEVSRIASKARDFAEEIGYGGSGRIGN